MTKQEAAAILRDAKSGNLEAITSVYGSLATIADLLDPPRDGLMEVTIALAWDDTQTDKIEVCAFGPSSWSFTQKTAFFNLAEAGATCAPTVIRAWVAPPDRRVAEVEGEVEG